MVLALGAVLNQLCHNAYPNLSRCFGVYCKAYWTKYLFKGALIKTLINQLVVNRVSFLATADHANVARLCL